MAWIRLDCSTLDNDLVINLSGDEFKAWTLFLLRCKALGARGSVPITSYENLARNWNVPAEAIRSMMNKVGDRITEESGRWYIKNWNRYQEDFRNKKSKNAYPENSGDTSEPTTVQHPTATSTATPPIERASSKTNVPSVKEVIDYFKGKEFINPNVEGEKFFNFYEGLDWMIRGNTIKNWRKIANNWDKKSKEWKEKMESNKNGRTTGKYDSVAD